MVHQILQDAFLKLKSASRLLSIMLAAGVLLFAALIGTTFSKPHRTVAATPESRAAPAVEQTKIVPADVMGTGSWSPVTGDSSN